jgi:hypothetical protein
MIPRTYRPRRLSDFEMLVHWSALVMLVTVVFAVGLAMVGGP